MEIQDTRENVKLIIIKLLIAIFGLGGTAIGSFLYNCSTYRIITNVVCIGVMVIVLEFLIEKKLCSGDENPASNLVRFFVLFAVFTVVSLLFPLFLVYGWCFLPIFLGLSLYSDKFTGFLSGVILLTSTVLIYGIDEKSVWVFLCYFIGGITVVSLFSELDESFKVVIPLIVSIIFQFLLIVLLGSVISDEKYSVSFFVIPATNMIVSAVMMLILLKRISYIILYETHDRYMDINDPEFELLSKLRDYNKKAYEDTLYTAVPSSKLAYNLKLNAEKCKACAYYHNIGMLEGDNSFADCERILIENEIPSEVINVIREYMTSSKLISKEAGVLLFAESVITSVGMAYEKYSNAEIDFKVFIPELIDKKVKSNILSESLLSFDDMRIITGTLIDESLFYDFLR